MGRVDEGVDPLALQVGGEAGGAAETADPGRGILVDDLRGSTGERHGDADVRPDGETPGEQPRLGRAAENEDVRLGIS